MQKNKQEIENYVNSLDGYEGYIQFSDRPIEDIFTTKQKIKVDAKNGFIYEAYFYNGKESITIKQINDSWRIATTQILYSELDSNDIQTYLTTNGIKINMAQIWEEKTDILCEDMLVNKLQKVVFVGFADVKVIEKYINFNKNKITYENLTKIQRKKLLNHFLNIFTMSHIDSILKDEE